MAMSETHIAIAGPATQEAKITAFAFDKTQRLVADARGYIVAKGDVKRTRELIINDMTGNGLTADTTGIAVSTAGLVTSSLNVKAMTGAPPEGWKPYFS